MVNFTKHNPPYEGWRPYCLVCSTMDRMEETSYGYRCVACGNQIDENCMAFPNDFHLERSEKEQ